MLYFTVVKEARKKYDVQQKSGFVQRWVGITSRDDPRRWTKQVTQFPSRGIKSILRRGRITSYVV